MNASLSCALSRLRRRSASCRRSHGPRALLNLHKCTSNRQHDHRHPGAGAKAASASGKMPNSPQPWPHRFIPPQRIEARQAKEAAKKAVSLSVAHSLLLTHAFTHHKLTCVFVARLRTRRKISRREPKQSEMCEAMHHTSHLTSPHAIARFSQAAVAKRQREVAPKEEAKPSSKRSALHVTQPHLISSHANLTVPEFVAKRFLARASSGFCVATTTGPAEATRQLTLGC